nr:hypothetical protein StreXyl84_71590 [Streptomyces sp. Xyl84]
MDKVCRIAAGTLSAGSRGGSLSLDHRYAVRGPGVRSANLRMAAISGFFGGVLGAVVDALRQRHTPRVPSRRETNVADHAMTGPRSRLPPGSPAC